MSTSTEVREQTIADYLTVVRRYKWVIVLTAVIVPVVAYAVSAQQSKVFRATSEVLLNRQDLGSVLTGIPTTNTVTDPDRYAQTQAALARVPVVARSAIKRAGVDMEAWELLASSSVTPRPNTDLLAFSVNNGDPAVAARLATAYATAFTAYKLRTDTASLSQAQKDLQARLAQLRREGGTETSVYRQLLQKAQDLKTLEILQVPASVVRAATNASQVKPTPSRNGVLGLLLGLILGLGGAFVLNALDRRVRDADEVELELQIPLLARLPGRRGADRLTILDRTPDEVTEAIGRLRTNFDFANSKAHARVVMATSAGPREGKSTTIADLAIALSRTGRHVVLVDLDLRRPALARLFHIPEGLGITDAATGKSDIEGIVRPIGHMPLGSRLVALRSPDANTGLLEVVTAGRTQVNPAEFVETAGLTQVLDRLRGRGELVLVDAPPILAAGDAMALTAKVDAILLVNRLGTLTRPALRELARALGRSPAPVLGFVATDAKLDDGYSMYRAEDYLAEPGAQAAERRVSAHLPEQKSAASAGRWSPRQPRP